MPTITFRVSDELAAAMDAARGEMGRSDWLRSLVEAKLLWGGEVVTHLAHNQEIVGANPTPATKPKPAPGAKAGRTSEMPERMRVEFERRISEHITGSWRTPRELAELTGMPERVVERVLGGMQIEWQRGSVTLR